MTIAIRLRGGVGNQLFQYCIGRRLADKNNDRLILDRSYYDKIKHCTYQLDKFNIRVDQPNAEDAKTNFQLIQEQSMNFIPEVLELKGDILLQGYWQSPKYVEDYIVRELIRNINKVRVTNTVAIHVRGADYKGWKKFDVCTYDYYNRAYRIMKEKMPTAVYAVFTDDIEYAKYMLHDVSKEEFLIYADNKLMLDDLIGMFSCSNIIASNSTFAWWGWRFSEKATSIFPSKWFNEEAGNKHHEEINLYTDKMILIDP